MRKAIGILAVLLAVVTALSGCSKYPTHKMSGSVDYSFAVTSQGGAAVQLGRYVYYINGQKEIYDEDGKQNVFGKVQKGGIYRSELSYLGEVVIGSDQKSQNGKLLVSDPYYGDYYTFVQPDSPLDKKISGFKQETPAYDADGEAALDDDELPIFLIDADPLVNKLATNGKDVTGGLFIFDEWLYFCSPSNLKSKNGVVQYGHVEFYRTKLDGSKTQFIYRTSTDPTDTANGCVSYGYYKYDGKVYLNVFEQDLGTVVSVAMTDKKTGRAKTIVTDATEVFFPRKDVYYKGMNENTLEDFVYFTRRATKDDKPSSGTVVSRIRPDGDKKSALILFNNGLEVSVVDIKQGAMFFTQVETTGMSAMYATDLGGFVLSHDWDDEKAPLTGGGAVQLVEFGNTDFSPSGNLSNIYPMVVFTIESQTGSIFRSYYLLATNAGKTVCIDAIGNQYPVLDTAAVVLAADNNYFYYATSDSETAVVYRASFAGVTSGVVQTGVQIIESSVVCGGFLPIDLCAGRLFFINPFTEIAGYPDDPTELYLHTVRLTGRGGETEFFIGRIDDADIPEEEEE